MGAGLLDEEEEHLGGLGGEASRVRLGRGVQAVYGSGRHREHKRVLIEELRRQRLLARGAPLDAGADQRGRGPHDRRGLRPPPAGVSGLEVLVGGAAVVLVEGAGVGGGVAAPRFRLLFGVDVAIWLHRDGPKWAHFVKINDNSS